MVLVQLECVEHAFLSHPAQQTDSAVTAERADLDRLAPAAQPCQHLEVQTVKPADRDGGQPRADGARADLREDVVLRPEHFLGPAGQLRRALAKSFFLGRARHELESTPAPPGTSPAASR